MDSPEEEEGDMFKKARQLFDEAELNELGERLAARKREVSCESAVDLQEIREAT